MSYTYTMYDTLKDIEILYLSYNTEKEGSIHENIYLMKICLKTYCIQNNMSENTQSATKSNIEQSMIYSMI